MSELVILSNVKIIKCLKGGIPHEGSQKSSDGFPPVDFFVTTGVVKIYADLPGVAPDDVFVYIYENYIVIEGSKKIRAMGADYCFLRLERHRASFKRIFKLPFTVISYNASINDGVLLITLKG